MEQRNPGDIEVRRGRAASTGGASGATAAPERAVAPAGETKATTDSRAAWDYMALSDSLAAGVGALGLDGRPRSEKQPIISIEWPHRTHPGILDLLSDSEASGEPMGMRPIEPGPNNPSDGAPFGQATLPWPT